MPPPDTVRSSGLPACLTGLAFVALALACAGPGPAPRLKPSAAPPLRSVALVARLRAPRTPRVRLARLDGCARIAVRSERSIERTRSGGHDRSSVGAPLGHDLDSPSASSVLRAILTAPSPHPGSQGPLSARAPPSS